MPVLLKFLRAGLALASLTLLVGVSPVSAAVPKVAWLTAAPAPAGKFEVLSRAAREQGFELDARYLEKLDEAGLARFANTADLLIVDTPRPGLLEFMLGKLGPLWSERKAARLLLDDERVEARGLDVALAGELRRYVSNGGRRNLEAAAQLIAARVFKLRSAEGIAPLQLMPAAAYYHPKLAESVTTRADEALAVSGKPGQPVVGVAIHQSYVSAVDSAYVDTLVADIERLGGRALVFYTPMMVEDAFLKMAAPGGKRIVDVLVNNQIMYDAGGRRAEFEKIGVPVIQAIPYRRGDTADWQADPQGMRLIDLPFYLVQSEIAGSMDPLIASAIAKQSGKVEAIAPQVRAIAAKAMNLAQLRRTANAEKRVAILFYNYPPGEKNLSASFLNLPKSLANTLAAMKAAGYRTETRDEDALTRDLGRLLTAFYRDDQLQPLLDAGLAAWLPMADYKRWFATQSPALREQVIARWGEPEKSAMAYRYKGEAGFVIPRLQLGNVSFMPVPPRGERKEDHEAAIYHSTKESLNHFYMAAYLWARSNRDALVHYGTHGTQEWTPGKERGLSMDDQPFVVLGDIPVVYPYIVDDVGEALQAKRRGRATIISHQTPSFRPAGLHTELNAMHDQLHTWLQQDEGGVKEALKRDLLRTGAKMHLFEDMGWTPARAEADFAQWINALHDHLHALAAQLQPYGLHAFGLNKSDELRLYTVMSMLGNDFYKRVEPEDPQEVFAVDYEKLAASKPFALLRHHLIEGAATREIRNAALREDVERAKVLWTSLDATPETTGLLAGLNGEFIPTSTGGDPVRNTDSLPTGRNLYGFDPSKIPTKAAWEAGQQATEAMLVEYRQRHGKYPQKLAYSLWSVETMRHAGVLEAQALAALGVRPKWDQGGRLSGVELIPAKELKRPRVDVVLSATGLYRDHFPNVMKWLAEAVKLAAAQNEPDNAVRAASNAIRAALAGKGLSEATLATLADTRIFSNQSGAYGTGLNEATLASDSFASKGKEADAKLATMYLSRMQYAYGPDEAAWGQKLEGVNLYAENLKGVEAALLARSSNLYGMLTTDDPFQYLGGLGQAVRHLTGKAPELLISNLRDPRAARTETAAGFLATELRTRNFHPGWIEGMKAEGYSGALNMLDSINNFWGWTATSPEIVRDDQWQEFAEVYVKDKYKMGLDKWFEQHAPQAQAQMIERMLEAARKDYWQTDAATLKQLAQRYQNLSKRFDIHSDNAAFRDFVAAKALAPTPGFGLQATAAGAAAPASPAPASQQAPEPVPAPPPVQGMKLEKVEPPALPPASLAWLFGGALMLLAFGGGALRSFLTTSSNPALRKVTV
ncbi:cobaltochelatase subunit CobN [Uliginosibacterium sp. TH139]|uniref:cobaltochelatase subunit CobN n=1 Tax=Uliginosibacterium sp. TH139 TaxID=2067453 RepID=UPI000C7AD7D7|nr:cobaltochelatase subunit CobN [Uliginosibacterium sp. TH139]PLK49236.1 cobaltochelatase subunit CobN [Uliginosibacterium sp. TH139]